MLRPSHVVLALAVLATSASAQTTNETRCRSAQSIYTAPCNGQGTATGFLDHRIRIRGRNGSILLSGNVKQFRDNQGVFVSQVVANSGGQYSIRFDLWFLRLYYPTLCGGTIEITDANGALIDVDSIT